MMYDMYVNDKDGQLLLEIPKNYAEKKYFIGSDGCQRADFCGPASGRLLRSVEAVQQAPRADLVPTSTIRSER